MFGAVEKGGGCKEAGERGDRFESRRVSRQRVCFGTGDVSRCERWWGGDYIQNKCRRLAPIISTRSSIRRRGGRRALSLAQVVLFAPADEVRRCLCPRPS